MKNKKQYIGQWSANNGSIYAYGYKGANKRTIANEMRDIARGNTFCRNTGYWEVYEIVDGVIENLPILSGRVKN